MHVHEHMNLDHTCIHMYIHGIYMYTQAETRTSMYIHVYTCIYHVNTCIYSVMYVPCIYVNVQVRKCTHTYIACMVYVHTKAFDIDLCTLYKHVCKCLVHLYRIPYASQSSAIVPCYFHVAIFKVLRLSFNEHAAAQIVKVQQGQANPPFNWTHRGADSPR